MSNNNLDAKALKPFWLIVPAAGLGKRLGGEKPKQYQELYGKTVIECAIEPFLSLPTLKGIVVALNPEDKYWKTLPLASHPLIKAIEGGAERSASVLNALQTFATKKDTQVENDDWVLVHDAARPCIFQEDVIEMMSTLGDSTVGGIMAIPVSDTIKRVSAIWEEQGAGDVTIESTKDRRFLWQAQTPQMFRFAMLLSAMENAIEEKQAITDESSAIEFLGYKPAVFQGKRSNMKITLPEDLGMAQQILSHKGQELS